MGAYNGSVWPSSSPDWRELSFHSQELSVWASRELTSLTPALGIRGGGRWHSETSSKVLRERQTHWHLPNWFNEKKSLTLQFSALFSLLFAWQQLFHHSLDVKTTPILRLIQIKLFLTGFWVRVTLGSWSDTYPAGFTWTALNFFFLPQVRFLSLTAFSRGQSTALSLCHCELLSNYLHSRNRRPIIWLGNKFWTDSAHDTSKYSSRLTGETWFSYGSSTFKLLVYYQMYANILTFSKQIHT